MNTPLTRNCWSAMSMPRAASIVFVASRPASPVRKIFWAPMPCWQVSFACWTRAKKKKKERLKILYSDQGLYRCHSSQACSFVCPKEINVSHFMALAKAGEFNAEMQMSKYSGKIKSMDFCSTSFFRRLSINAQMLTADPLKIGLKLFWISWRQCDVMLATTFRF